MELYHVHTHMSMNHEPGNTTSTRLDGIWLIAARLVWFVVVTLTLAVFFASIPEYFAQRQSICRAVLCGTEQLTSESAQALHMLGISVTGYAIFNITLIIISAVVWFAVAAVIFWYKSNDWMALLVSGLLVTECVAGTSTLTNPLRHSTSTWLLLAHFVDLLALAAFLLSCSLFPNGQFVPRWTRWLIVVFIVASIPTIFFPTLPFSHPLNIGVELGLAVFVVVVQLYRYRRVSSPVQCQQTKWAVYGATAAIGVFLAWYLPPLIFPVLSLPGSLYSLIFNPIFTLLTLVFPLCIGFAILRYRLWDIDVLINRTLVYGTFTGTLALIYFGLIVGLQYLLRGIISQPSEVVIVISTLAIAALFQPLLHRIQRAIDRRFYRSKYDAARTLEIFSASLRNEIDLATLSEQLLAVVQETMQPTHVSLWLRKPEQDGEHEGQVWRKGLSEIQPEHLSDVEMVSYQESS